MKSHHVEPEEIFRPEYNLKRLRLKRLRVRKLGAERKSFAGMVVRLDPDVAELFQSADAVNEALRFLAKMTQENPLSESKRGYHS